VVNTVDASIIFSGSGLTGILLTAHGWFSVSVIAAESHAIKATGRIIQYREKQRIMEPQRDHRLVKGIEEFNRGLYFECHETLEEIWLEDHGEDREFYQGIIQIAAGYLKWEQGVLMGAIKLMRSGLEKISAYPSTHLGVKVDSFAHGVKANLREIEIAHQTKGTPPELQIPPLSLKSGDIL
jgi:hypothetical protein